MSNANGFQVVCINCGCLSIKISEPLKSPRDAIVRCGDCGSSRGTVGALRDLAVQRCSNIAFPKLSAVLEANDAAADEKRSASTITRRYAELKRLRYQVKIAERLANVSSKPFTVAAHKSDVTPSGFRRSVLKTITRLGDKREDERPH